MYLHPPPSQTNERYSISDLRGKKMSTVFSTEDILQAWTGLANTYLYIKPMYKFTQYMYMYVDYKAQRVEVNHCQAVCRTRLNSAF